MPESDQQTKADAAYVSIDLRPVWWARLFLQTITLKVFVDHVVLPDGRETRDGFTVNKGLTGATQLLWSSPEGEGSWNANKRKRADVEASLQYVDSFKDASRLKCLADHSSALFNSARFVSKSELDAAIAMAGQNDALSLLDSDRRLHPTLKGYQQLAIRLLESGEETRQAHNQRFIDDSLQRHDSFFNDVESNPLTSAQRRSIVGNEDANLVVAGAGSGKTSTIIARIAYLSMAEMYSPRASPTAAAPSRAHGDNSPRTRNERSSTRRVITLPEHWPTKASYLFDIEPTCGPEAQQEEIQSDGCNFLFMRRPKPELLQVRRPRVLQRDRAKTNQQRSPRPYLGTREVA